MRIIAGELKGRNVELPRGSKSRPATGFVRELVMNLLETRGPDAGSLLSVGPFLDLFAASGVSGFEALSRGAPESIFVEIDGRHSAQINRNAYSFGIQARVKVLTCDARRIAKPLARHLGERRLAAAFADPPYIPGFAPGVLPHFGKLADLFHPAGLLIVRAVEKLPETVPGLSLIESRSAGKGRLYIYVPQAGAGSGTSDGP
jgi:16S rRNA (guanine966-N2)-methyltransferase